MSAVAAAMPRSIIAVARRPVAAEGATCSAAAPIALNQFGIPFADRTASPGVCPGMLKLGSLGDAAGIGRVWGGAHGECNRQC